MEKTRLVTINTKRGEVVSFPAGTTRQWFTPQKYLDTEQDIGQFNRTPKPFSEEISTDAGPKYLGEQIHPLANLLLRTLYDVANKEGDLSFSISDTKLQRMTGMSKTSIAKFRAELVDFGVIAIVRANGSRYQYGFRKNECTFKPLQAKKAVIQAPLRQDPNGRSVYFPVDDGEQLFAVGGSTHSTPVGYRF